MDMNEKNRVEGGVLYLVGTPIGNLADISERAKKVLSEVDFIAAEDTRNSAKLLLCLGIKGELVSYHEHNKRVAGERLIARLLAGESCALITDAGMPAISDPGEDVVALAADAGIKVSVVPGPCAAVSALAMSGLPTGRFAFEGFLPVKGKERRGRIEMLAREIGITVGDSYVSFHNYHISALLNGHLTFKLQFARRAIEAVDLTCNEGILTDVVGRKIILPSIGCGEFINGAKHTLDKLGVVVEVHRNRGVRNVNRCRTAV